MAKLKCFWNQYSGICSRIAGSILLLSLSAVTIPANYVAASDDAVKWTRVNIPTEGEAGNWVLADGSDVQHLTISQDGTLYAYGKGLTYTLYRSTDGGVGWSSVGNVQDAITDIAISPADAGTIYYATTSTVYRSTDDGKTFHSLPPAPGGAGTNNIEITSIDVVCPDSNIIAVGTRDTDSSEFGGVYTLDEANIYIGWTDTNLASYDVYAVAFPPGYTFNPQLVAVVTDETDTFTASKFGSFGWGTFIGNARLNRDNSGASVAVTISAAIAFPGNYDADVSSENCVYFTAINTGADQGDVYKINCAHAPFASTAIDLNIGYAYGLSNTDITGLAACGDNPAVNLMTGAADSAHTYFSSDGGSSWTMSSQEPSGESETCVLMAPDFISTGLAYSATSGAGSALSVSRDSGDTWNQLSLIDATISSIIDLASSPDYSHDNALFMITFGNKHSLWHSPDGGDSWERILSGHLANVDSLTAVDLAPLHDDDSRTVFITGESNGRPTIWQSTGNNQNYRRRFTHDPDTGTAFTIDTWAVVDENTLFIGSYDGSNGIVYKTTNGGFFYSEGVPIGSQSLNSLTLSPGYDQDGTILAGNTNGWVYWSDNNGTSFQSLPVDATSPPLSGSITVAFDPEFDSNNTVYAASDTADSGVFRFIIGASTDWESIDGTLPGGAMLNQVIAADDGTLYAANSDSDGGMERCLNPASLTGATFETVIRGLGDGATLSGLWQFGHRLWSIDTANIMLMTFHDTMTPPVTLLSPEHEASGAGNLIDHTIRNISLDWETLEGATSYQWQCDCDTDLSSVPAGFEDSTQASSARLPALESSTTYYWRVRASAPVLSPWSDKWSFTTSLATNAISLRLETPAAGAVGVPVKPVFQWTAIAGADAYELLISTNADFTNPAIIKKDDYALPSNAWRCDVSLDGETTYYWKVRAISASTNSAWSAAGAFTTESPPTVESGEPPAEPESLIPPQPPEVTSAITLMPQPATPPEMQIKPPVLAAISPESPPLVPTVSQPPGMQDWVMYLVGGLLFTIMFALIIIFTMVLKMKRF